MWTGYSIVSYATGVPKLVFQPDPDRNSVVGVAESMVRNNPRIKVEVWKWKLGQIIDPDIWVGGAENEKEKKSSAS